jgi:hypothetical protein
MRTFLPTSQDATIYERYPTLNTGLDEVIEVGKVIKSLDGSAQYASGSARILIQFNIPSNQQYSSGSEYYLNLRIADAKNINRYQQLLVYPVSQSWIEGSGYFYQDTQNAEDGVTWENSTRATNWTVSGSDYTTQLSASYILSAVPIEDIKINVTNLIAPVVSGSNTTPWNGLIVKFPSVDELNSTNVGNIKFFSGNTHTIFAPKLEIVSVNQPFTTGSLKPIPNGNVTIVPKNIKESYTRGEIDKVYLVVREPYPDKKFNATQRYKNIYYLPSESYYRVRDQVADIAIYDFDQYSTINCDASGSYIVLDTSGLDVNRYYTLDLKVKSAELVFFPEFNYTFKIDTDE